MKEYLSRVSTFCRAIRHAFVVLFQRDAFLIVTVSWEPGEGRYVAKTNGHTFKGDKDYLKWTTPVIFDSMAKASIKKWQSGQTTTDNI